MRKSPNSRFGFIQDFFLDWFSSPAKCLSPLGPWCLTDKVAPIPSFGPRREQEDKAMGPEDGNTSRKPWERMCRET